MTKDDPLIGQVLDERWRVDGLLGKGGMARVYKGHQLSVGREVAIKVMLAGMESDPTFGARFEREARMTSQLNHRNCITVFDYGITETGQAYMVMELLRGETFAARQARIETPLPILLRLCEQLLAGLAAAHREGIVHRDLKPENVFVLEDAEGLHVRVVDFGIAKALGTSTALTLGKGFIGTPHFASPEQCRGLPLDHRSDLYSFGCMLHQLLTGRTVFQKTDPIAVLVAHASEAPPAIEGPDAAALPSGLVALVHTLLAKDPNDRVQTALEVRAIIRREREALGAAPRPVPVAVSPDPILPQTVAQDAGAGAAAPTGSTPVGLEHLDVAGPIADAVGTSQGASPGKGRWALWSVAAAVLVAVAVFALRGETPSPPAGPGDPAAVFGPRDPVRA